MSSVVRTTVSKPHEVGGGDERGSQPFDSSKRVETATYNLTFNTELRVTRKPECYWYETVR